MMRVVTHSFKRVAISSSVIGVPSSVHTAFSSSTVMLPDLGVNKVLGMNSGTFPTVYY